MIRDFSETVHCLDHADALSLFHSIRGEPHIDEDTFLDNDFIHGA